MTTVREYFESHMSGGGLAVKKLLLDLTPDRLGSYETYIDISGRLMAPFDYWEHNVSHYDIRENAKWFGIEIYPENMETIEWLQELYGVHTVKVVIPQWCMNIKAKNAKHAFNLMRKYGAMVRENKKIAV